MAAGAGCPAQATGDSDGPAMARPIECAAFAAVLLRLAARRMCAATDGRSPGRPSRAGDGLVARRGLGRPAMRRPDGRRICESDRIESAARLLRARRRRRGCGCVDGAFWGGYSRGLKGVSDWLHSSSGTRAAVQKEGGALNAAATRRRRGSRRCEGLRAAISDAADAVSAATPISIASTAVAWLFYGFRLATNWMYSV
jgi:hypothetical protein